MPSKTELREPQPTETEIRETVAKLRQSKRLSRRAITLLSFMVEQTLGGNDALLSSPKQISDALLRPDSEDVDPSQHLVYRSLVLRGETASDYEQRMRTNKDAQLRLVKHRLQSQLQQYRMTDGKQDRVEIVVAQRTFKVTFQYRDRNGSTNVEVAADPEDLLLKLNDLNDRARWLEEKRLFRKLQEANDQIEDTLDDVFTKRIAYSPIIIDSITTVGRNALIQGAIDFAEFQFKSAMELCLTQQKGDQSLEFADCLESMAKLAIHKGHFQEAKIYLLRCAEGREQHLGPLHPRAAKARREYDLFRFINEDPRLDMEEPPDEGLAEEE